MHTYTSKCMEGRSKINAFCCKNRPIRCMAYTVQDNIMAPLLRLQLPSREKKCSCSLIKKKGTTTEHRTG